MGKSSRRNSFPPFYSIDGIVSDTTYENPLVTRYASKAMAELWSSQKKFSTWRQLWGALADSESSLGGLLNPNGISWVGSSTGDAKKPGAW
jgi:hypothetical protein